MKNSILISILLAVLPSPALAKNLNDGDACSFGTSFEGPGNTTVIVRQNQEDFDDEDTVYIGVFNEIWSIKDGDQLGEIKFQNEGGAWFSSPATAIEHGFVVYATYDNFKNVFETSGGLGIFRNNKQIDGLSLLSMYSDVLDFGHCRAPKASAKYDRERKEGIDRRWSKDPFAK